MPRLLSILLLCVVATLTAFSKSSKKKMALPAPPEPDPMVEMRAPDAGLPRQAEAKILTIVDLKWREGIDVSHYQHLIDWDAVARDGEVSYVYIKATEGAELVDDMYDYNIREARKAGLRVGSYHFFRAHVSIDAQFANMTSTVKADMQDLIPIVDVESTNRVNTATMVRRLKQFLQRLTEYYGRKPMLYTFVNFYNKHLVGQGLEEYPLMIAFYRDAQPELRDGRKYTIWQYTSHGDIPGIDGNVDRSILMDDFTFQDIRF